MPDASKVGNSQWKTVTLFQCSQGFSAYQANKFHDFSLMNYNKIQDNYFDFFQVGQSLILSQRSVVAMKNVGTKDTGMNCVYTSMCFLFHIGLYLLPSPFTTITIFLCEQNLWEWIFNKLMFPWFDDFFLKFPDFSNWKKKKIYFQDFPVSRLADTNTDSDSLAKNWQNCQLWKCSRAANSGKVP